MVNGAEEMRRILAIRLVPKRFYPRKRRRMDLGRILAKCSMNVPWD